MEKKKRRSMYALPDYLCASGRIRCLETKLVTKEKAARMAEAASIPDAYRVLAECGYNLSQTDTSAEGTKGIYELSRLINAERALLYAECESMTATKKLTVFFRVPTDCHNIKAVIKAEASGSSAEGLLIDGGTCPTDKLKAAVFSDKHEGLGAFLAAAADAARQALAKTGDAQLADFAVDKAQLAWQHALAAESGSDFLVKYAALTADSANLRSAVRLMRQPDGAALLTSALSDAGTIKPSSVIKAAQEGKLDELYKKTLLEKAAELGQAAVESRGALTEFEHACSSAVADIFAMTKYTVAGSELVVAYIAAKEREFRLVRTVMSAKMTGAPTDAILEKIAAN